MGFWERLTNGKMRKCVAFKIVDVGPAILSEQRETYIKELEGIAKPHLMGSFFYSRDGLNISDYERNQIMKIPFSGSTRDGHFIFEERSKSTIVRYDISPLGETALLLTYVNECTTGNILYIIEFKLER